MAEKIYYIDRQTQERKEEKVYFEQSLHLLYGTFWGRWLCEPIAKLPLISRVLGWWQRLSITKKRIAPFISKYGINPSEFEKEIEAFPSFDAFFTRTLKKEARPLGEGVILPADGRYLFYPNIDRCDGFIVKGKKFSIEKLLMSQELADRYADGIMVIARLCPSDYHRFHFPVDCTPAPPKLINGPLYSVNPIAVKKNIDLLTENKRVITHLNTENHGKILFIEIGATTVGSIHQTFFPFRPYKKGDEKGFFSFGASSLILLFEKGSLHCAPDLIKNSESHLETFCLFGQSLEKEI